MGHAAVYADIFAGDKSRFFGAEVENHVGDIKGIADPARRVGVFSLDFVGQDNAEIAYRLEADYGIQTRCGLHCAPAAHKTLGTFPRGTVRFSTGWFTTESDIDAALAAVKALTAT